MEPAKTSVSMGMMKTSAALIFVGLLLCLSSKGGDSRGNDTKEECYGGRAKCNESHIVKVQRGYWVGFGPDSSKEETVVGLCAFCRSFRNDSTHVGEFMTIDLHNQCADGRNQTSIMCSSCNNDYSIAINSAIYHDCVQCTNERGKWSFFVLNIVILFIFLLFIFIFDFSLVCGALNPLVFFGQMTTTTLKLDMHGAIPMNNVTSISTVYQAVNAFWKLDLTYVSNDFCFAKNMTMVQVLALKYVVALMALLPVVVLVLFAKNLDKISNAVGKCLRRLHCSEGIAAMISNCSCFSRFPWINRAVRFSRDASIQTLVASCLLLSFTKFNIITFYLLAPTNLYDESGSVSEKVLYYDGSLLYPGSCMNTWIAAVFFLITVIILFPILLLLLRYNLVESRNTASSKCGHILWYLDKFLDKCFLMPFQKDLKDRKYQARGRPCSKIKLWRFSFGIHDYRWYAGWYLLLRSSLFAISIFSMTYISQLILQQLLITVALGITVTLRPYKHAAHNRLDAFIFLLILIINFAVFYQFYLTLSTSSSTQVYLIQYTLCFIPTMLIVLYFFIKLFNNWRRDQNNWNRHMSDHDQTSNVASQSSIRCIERCLCGCNITLLPNEERLLVNQ